jgi:predicted dehydrogenase
MRDVAAQMKVATQMGNQGTAENGLRRATEIIRAGVLGKITEVHVWTNRPIWPQGPEAILKTRAGGAAALAALHGKSLSPLPTVEVPKNIHWDLFLGPAAERPFDPIYPSFSWRGWLDFGTGALGDMACHTANMAFMALQLSLPTAVEAKSAETNPETFPTWAVIDYHFPAIEGRGPVKLTWYEGQERGKKKLPNDKLLHGEKPSDSGSLLVGERGILYSPNDYGAAYKFLGANAAELEAAAKDVAETLPRNGRGDKGMKEEWIAAIKGGPAAVSNFEYATRLTESMLLGNVAVRAGKRIEYDSAAGKITNDATANSYLHYEYRSGWTL